MNDGNPSASEELSAIDDAEKELVAATEGDPGDPEAVGKPEAEADGDATGEGDVEYEYLYEDESGNPIPAPGEDLDPSRFEEEVVEVIEQPEGEQSAGESELATANIPPESRETRRTRSGSTRRMSDHRTGRRSKRQSGRSSSRETDLAQMKYARLKTILMVGSLALIPILIVAIILTYCYKNALWPFRRDTTRRVYVQNDYELGRDMTSKAWSGFEAANRNLKGKDDQYYPVLQQCETNYIRGLELMHAWREKHPGPGYSSQVQRIRDANVKLRVIREQKHMIEMRRSLQK